MRTRPENLCAAVVALTLAGAAGAAGTDKNTTGLPTYPHEEGGRMDQMARMLPNGQHCTHYSSSSKDALESVIDWYRKQLPSAKTDDVNKDSLYGSYFKLQGVKLLIGNNIVNVYRMADNAGLPYVKQGDLKKTTIELFKCSDAPEPGHH